MVSQAVSTAEYVRIAAGGPTSGRFRPPGGTRADGRRRPADRQPRPVPPPRL